MDVGTRMQIIGFWLALIFTGIPHPGRGGKAWLRKRGEDRTTRSQAHLGLDHAQITLHLQN